MIPPISSLKHGHLIGWCITRNIPSIYVESANCVPRDPLHRCLEEETVFYQAIFTPYITEVEPCESCIFLSFRSLVYSTNSFELCSSLKEVVLQMPWEEMITRLGWTKVKNSLLISTKDLILSSNTISLSELYPNFKLNLFDFLLNKKKLEDFL